MFAIGEFVQYGNSGVCCVADIVNEVAGRQSDRDYYLLVPVGSANGKIYTPVDNGKVTIRRILSADEVHALVEDIPKIGSLSVQDERSREQCYREALNSCSCMQWVGALKALYARRRCREEQGKKLTNTDERYIKSVEDRLFEEIAVSLGKDKTDVKAYLSTLLEDN